MAILGTLLIHAFFLLLLVLIEIALPTVSKEDLITVEFAPEEVQQNINLSNINNNIQTQGNDDFKDIKNIEANAGDKNKSFDDYYREVQNIVDKSKPDENFKANDYADKRWLAKDYSKEQGFIVQEEKQENKTNNSNDKSNSKNTYAGKAIITYNLGGRKALRLPVPAYQCLGSGEVIIEIFVNQKGNVISAQIVSAKTTLNENCLSDASVKSAFSSKFAIDLKAPTSQKGTINYKFIGQ